MESEKKVGYALLSIGILLMVFSSLQIILVFTGKATPIEMFSFADALPQTNNEIRPQPLQKTSAAERALQMQKDPLSLLQNSVGNVGLPNGIDTGVINKILNLTVYYFIMQFVLGLGYKLAFLGVQIIRPLKIAVEKSKLQSILTPHEPQG